MAKLPTPTAANMARTLRAFIASKGTASWADITAHVNQHYTVKNWLTQVRGPLQWMVDNGHAKRVPSIHVEEYTL